MSIIAPAADSRSVEPSVVVSPSELLAVAAFAEISVLAVDNTVRSTGSAAKAHADDRAAASLGFITFAAMSQSAVFIFAVQAISKAVAEFVLENWSEDVHVITMKAHRSWQERMGILLGIAVKKVALLGVSSCQKIMRAVASAVFERKAAVHDV